MWNDIREAPLKYPKLNLAIDFEGLYEKGKTLRPEDVAIIHNFVTNFGTKYDQFLCSDDLYQLYVEINLWQPGYIEVFEAGNFIAGIDPEKPSFINRIGGFTKRTEKPQCQSSNEAVTQLWKTVQNCVTASLEL